MADLCSHEIGFFFRSRIAQVSIYRGTHNGNKCNSCHVQNWKTESETLVDKLENKSQDNGNRPERLRGKDQTVRY